MTAQINTRSGGWHHAINYLYAFLIGFMLAIVVTHPRPPFVNYEQFADMVFEMADKGLLLVKDGKMYTILLVEE